MVSILHPRKFIEAFWLKFSRSVSCGMFYRRIIDLEGDVETQQVRITSAESNPRSPFPERTLGERKRSQPFHESQNNGVSNQEEQSDSEDDIHNFRRVHLKSKHGVFLTKSYPSLRLREHGLELRMCDNKALRSYAPAALVTSATKPLSEDFSYFEIEIVGQRGKTVEDTDDPNT